MNNFFLKFSAFLLLGVLAATFSWKHTDKFTITGISSSRPYNPSWETRPLSPEEKTELDNAINQQYHYLGCGGQSFIFLSADKNYVIKFFKQRVFEMPLWLRYIHLPWKLDNYRKKKLWKRQDKLERDFTSYKLSFEELKPHTGVLFVHLNKTCFLKKQLTLVDKLGISHNVDLDQMDFLIQKTAILAVDKISDHMREGKPEQARAAIRSILYLIVDRCKKGFHDRDPNVRTNCGFIGNQAIKIDVGRFIADPNMPIPSTYIKEVERISKPFREWLATYEPSLVPILDEELILLKEAP